MAKTPREPSSTASETGADRSRPDRAARLGQALRDNLKRRKAAKRKHAASDRKDEGGGD